MINNAGLLTILLEIRDILLFKKFQNNFLKINLSKTFVNPWGILLNWDELTEIIGTSNHIQKWHLSFFGSKEASLILLVFAIFSNHSYLTFHCTFFINTWLSFQIHMTQALRVSHICVFARRYIDLSIYLCVIPWPNKNVRYL